MIKINTFQSTIKSIMKQTKLNENMALIAVVFAIAIEIICPLIIMYDHTLKMKKIKNIQDIHAIY